MALGRTTNAKRIALLMWVLVAAFYFYLSYDYIRIEMNDNKLADYVRYVVQLAGNERRTPREVRTLLLVKADELGIPLTSDQIRVQGNGPSLNVLLQYDINIDVPVLRPGFYSKHYEHQVNYRQPH